jgi:GDPmannose 4,6-dehydratase
MKTAVIFGVTGQDGSYLGELLLAEGYRVVGVSRRTSTPNTARIPHLLAEANFELVRGDVTDAMSVYRVLDRERMRTWEATPYAELDSARLEVYNLAAMSHVGDSFVEPHYTAQVTYLGALNCLEALKEISFSRTFDATKMPQVRFYQASSSEMFGSAWSWRDENGYEFHQWTPPGRRDLPRLNPYQSERTPLRPNSPTRWPRRPPTTCAESTGTATESSPARESSSTTSRRAGARSS